MFRLQRIVVGVDFGDPCVEALRWSTTHLAPDAHHLLVHVVEPATGPKLLAPPLNLANLGDAEAVEAGGARLRDLAREYRGAVSTHVLAGSPSDELARFARQEGARLIVIGAHGKSRRDWTWAGSTAERLAGCTPPAVLVARCAPETTPKKILVAVDNAPVTNTVLDWATFLSERFGAELTLLHVLSNAAITHVASLAAATSRNPTAPEHEVDKALVTEGARWLDSIASTEANPRAVTTDIRFGRVGDVIIDRARALSADLIVMGRHSRGPTRPTRLGRTVRAVLHGAPCSVLIVGADE